MELVGPDLQAHGEWDEVSARVHSVGEHGTAAARYRRLMEHTGDLKAVTAAAVAETASETA